MERVQKKDSLGNVILAGGKKITTKLDIDENIFIDSLNDRLEYQLVSCTQHLGNSSQSGHYYAHVRYYPDIIDTSRLFSNFTLLLTGTMMSFTESVILRKWLHLEKLTVRDHPCSTTDWSTSTKAKLYIK